MKHNPRNATLGGAYRISQARDRMRRWRTRYSHFYDRQGRAISLRRWSALFENWKYRVVAQTVVAPDVRVSTIWTGIDMSLGQGYVFETMVFGGTHDGDTFRPGTERAARRNHNLVVDMVRRAER